MQQSLFWFAQSDSFRLGVIERVTVILAQQSLLWFAQANLSEFGQLHVSPQPDDLALAGDDRDLLTGAGGFNRFVM